jgi:hypothetical protein
MTKTGLNPIRPPFCRKQAAAALFALGLFTSGGTHASLVINEIDYDQPGSDEAEFIELYNSGPDILPLDGFRIDLINGNNSTSYRSIDLSGFSISASSFFVVCSDNGLVANCDYSFTSATSWFQNGAPDAVALYQADIIHDRVSYEGSVSLFTEGTGLDIADSNTMIMSLARILDGIDSDNNALDFQQSCITPGMPNIAGQGDCSSQIDGQADGPAVNPVPLPAAAWLLASGLIGLGFTARRPCKITDSTTQSS